MMSVDTICERKNIIKKLWNREHDPHVIDILLKQLKSDIIFFCSERIPYELQIQIDELQDEVWKYDNK